MTKRGGGGGGGGGGEGGKGGGESGGGEKAASRPITGDCGLTSGVTPVKSGDTYVRHWPVSRAEDDQHFVSAVVGTGQFGQFSGLICLFTAAAAGQRLFFRRGKSLCRVREF